MSDPLRRTDPDPPALDDSGLDQTPDRSPAVGADQLALEVPGLPTAAPEVVAERRGSGPVTLASMWRTPLRWPSRRTWAALLAAGVLVSGTGAGAYRLGTEHAALGPTVLATPATGESVAQTVFAAAHKSVVTLSVPGGGTGSGFFIAPGRILTNYHVVATSQDNEVALRSGQPAEVGVLLADGRRRTGVVKLADARLDMAIVDVDADLGVAPLAFADSARAVPGQPVVVIGTPFGLTATVTEGVLSGLGRATEFAEDPVQSGLLQFDAAVNPGNSGGPLLDASGRVLGMVTLRPDTSDGRTVSDIAFALPASALLAAVAQLEEFGQVSHPAMGVQLRDVSPDDEQDTGAVVSAVVDGSPADEAGVRAGDVITALGSGSVAGFADVMGELSRLRADDRVGLQVVRGDQVLQLTVNLRERPVS